MQKESEIDVIALFWIVWDHKYWVIAAAFLGGAIAAAFALTATPTFRAQVIVTEVHENGLGAGGGIAGQLGGLASIAGLSLGGNGPDAERAAVLDSRGLAAAFVKRYNLTSVMNAKAKVKPTEWSAVERFRHSVVDVHEEKLKGTTTITVDWTDPQTAARWANDYVGLANDLLRERAIDESTRNIDYLTKQVSKTNVVEMQRAIYELIEAQTKSLMLANGRTQYAFTIVDPAVPPEVRFSPRRTLMVISGLFGGGFLGSLFVWARSAIRRTPVAPTH